MGFVYSRRRAFGVALGVWFVAGFAASTGAQPKPAQNAGRGAYEQVIQEALAEHERGNWVEARALFERAHELQPSARTLRAIGLVLFEEKRYVAAVVHLRESLDDARKPLTADQREQVADVLRRARGFVAQYTLQLEPADAEVRVDSEPPVIVDGKLLLDPGMHELLVSAEGYQPLQRRLRAQPREERVLEIALQPLESESAPVEAQPSVEDLGQPATEPVGGLSTLQYIGVGVGAVGLAGLVTSGIFTLRALSKKKESGCEARVCPSEEAERLNRQALNAGNVATVAGIVGIAALATGAFLVLWSPPDEKQDTAPQVSLVPTLSPTYAGASLGATW